ncbi:MAG: precorrin-2 C(20)-methyltransferase [Deltaproteobacteria bacterium HGW-Deltaproteobacteria-18]|nr:MAG: precorrin-2 C(20)-methyltransferase [Deltaproteobacteria bacterium HGW-Deltaproteobacteria-18]
MSGHLYGIGVGPGDPELLTIKAAGILGRVDVILAASSTKNDDSLALDIARPHLKADARVIRLGFPMSRDTGTLQSAWEENARLVLNELAKGHDAAFLTLGDPLLYSTFAYLLRTLRSLAPEQAVTVIPGITSFQAVAAATETVLAESAQNLLILPGIRDAADLRRSLESADNAVILKAYTNFSAIRDELRTLPTKAHCVFASRMGMKDQFITRSLDEAPDNPTYLSLMLLTKNESL